MITRLIITSKVRIVGIVMMKVCTFTTNGAFWIFGRINIIRKRTFSKLPRTIFTEELLNIMIWIKSEFVKIFRETIGTKNIKHVKNHSFLVWR